MNHGVTYDVQYQDHYDRTQVVIRILVLIVLSILAGAIGWVFGLLYLIVPVAAAVLISQKGGATYIAESEGGMQRWLAYIAAIYSWLFLLTDKLPSDDPRSAIRFDVTPEGEPSAGNVLLRIILGIPHAIVLGILGIVAGLLALIAAIMVLISESYPESIFNFLRGYMRWEARLYVYLAGFVQEYPPFALDTGSEAATPPSAPAETSSTQPTA